MLASYYAEIDLFCIIILITLMIQTHSSGFAGSHKFYFKTVLLSSIAFFLTDLIWVFNNGYLSLSELLPRSGQIVSYVFNELHLLSLAATGLTWLLFSEAIQGTYWTMRRGRFALLLIPFCAAVLLLATTPWTRFIFSVTKEGEFVRGPGRLALTAIAYGYVALAVILSLIRASRAGTVESRQRSMSSASLVIPMFVCGVLESLLNTTVLFIGTVVSLLSVFISLQKLQVRTDPLTGLNNRTLLDQKITAAIQSLDGEQELYLLIFDADHFKRINDDYGHLEGDRAITLIADALKHCPMNPSDFVCRYGGDEFVLLHRSGKNDCSLLVDSVRERLAAQELPYALTVSVGVCRYTPDMSGWQDLLSAADRDMYQTRKARRAKAEPEF